MPQFARPNSDITNQSYTDDDAGTSSIFLAIDETTPDDTDYVQSAFAPTDDVYVCGLSGVSDPLSSSDHVVRYRISKDAASGTAIDMTVQLRQGYVSEGSQGTLIAEYIHTDISEIPTTYVQTLSPGEANSISNYSALSLRFVSDQP